MDQGIKVRGLLKPKPNVGLYVFALITLARDLQERRAGSAAPAAEPLSDTSGEASHERG